MEKLSKDVYPLDEIGNAFNRLEEFTDDTNAYRVLQSVLFPDWVEKAQEIDASLEKERTARQQRLRADIVKLENKLRERGITGQAGHKMLVYLFFLALFEDKRGSGSRFTLEGFSRYITQNIPGSDRLPSSPYHRRGAHHLMDKEIKAEPVIGSSGMLNAYEPIILEDDFILSEVLPVFDKYTFSDSGIDAIGAVFEALARKGEKDNRIGQFFTPETVVDATSDLIDPEPTDLTADPACGTGRFLIQTMNMALQKVARGNIPPGKTVEEAGRDIREKQLLGADIDPWIAAIAKMNMYIHGDGKSNVRQGNGLALSTNVLFAPIHTGTLNGQLDVVLTNPPLPLPLVHSKPGQVLNYSPVEASLSTQVNDAESTLRLLRHFAAHQLIIFSGL